MGVSWVRVRVRVRAHLDERRLGHPAVAEAACVEQQGGAEDGRRNPHDAVEEHLGCHGTRYARHAYARHARGWHA